MWKNKWAVKHCCKYGNSTEVTWTNKHANQSFITIILDKLYVFNDEFRVDECKFLVDHDSLILDLLPILIQLRVGQVRSYSRGSPPFKFNVSMLEDNAWCNHLRSWDKARSLGSIPTLVWKSCINAIIVEAKKKGKSMSLMCRR